ncbi:MAG: urease accessory protein UreD [Algisphaera sp.]
MEQELSNMPDRKASPGGETSGAGYLEVQQVGGRSVLTGCHAAAPLKLLTPRRRGGTAWVYQSSFGGGLVAGDTFRLYADLHEQTTTVLTTQAATKVFHQQDGVGAEQNLQATVSNAATLIVAPDPLTCFANAMYLQRQSFDLAPDASLVLLDWLTCGRVARGERWSFDRYESRNVIRIDGEEIVFDRLVLDASEESPSDAFAAGPFDVMATLYLVGPAAQSGCAAAQAWVAGLPPTTGRDFQVGYSPQPWGGVLRIMGCRTQRAIHIVKERLAFLTPLLGTEVFGRRA